MQTAKRSAGFFIPFPAAVDHKRLSMDHRLQVAADNRAALIRSRSPRRTSAQQGPFDGASDKSKEIETNRIQGLGDRKIMDP